MVLNRRRPRHLFAAAGDLAVEHPQRVCRTPPFAVAAEKFQAVGNIRDEPGPIAGSTGGAAKGVQLQADGNPQFPHKHRPHRHKFGIDPRIFRTQHLDVHLMKLAEPTFLGTLVPEHRADGKQPLHRFLGIQAMFDIGPQQGRGRLRAHRYLLVDKGIHLFFDNIGGLADGSGEEFGFFQDRQADFAEMKPGKNIPGHLFEVLPELHLARHNIFKPFQGLNFHYGLQLCWEIWGQIQVESKTLNLTANLWFCQVHAWRSSLFSSRFHCTWPGFATLSAVLQTTSQQHTVLDKNRQEMHYLISQSQCPL
ncbi:MAG: hypothetical protein ACD_75C02102G0004 [uncultured bacterium]|nr:MAG: hypothetical protein ACD_75C02102G0004 [uncultured bacterium]